MKHALVVGGTGMLSGVSLSLLAKGYHVSIIARNAYRIEKLVEKTRIKEQITPILVDYKNNNELRTKVNASIMKNGDIDLVVAWIHSNAPDALKIIAKEVSFNKNEWELFHVLGSSSDLSEIKKKNVDREGCLYYQIRLGYVMESNRSRWLTNKEISDGVIEAINNKNKIHTVGQIEPWDKRP